MYVNYTTGLYLHVCPTFFQTFVCSLMMNDVFIVAKIKNIYDATQLVSDFKHFRKKNLCHKNTSTGCST